MEKHSTTDTCAITSVCKKTIGASGRSEWKSAKKLLSVVVILLCLVAKRSGENSIPTRRELSFHYPLYPRVAFGRSRGPRGEAREYLEFTSTAYTLLFHFLRVLLEIVTNDNSKNIGAGADNGEAVRQRRGLPRAGSTV